MTVEQITTCTQDTSDLTGVAAIGSAHPKLIRFFRADDPLGLVEGFPLTGAKEWLIGRIQGRMRGAAGEGRIWTCDDATMSSRHAILSKGERGWVLTDAGSKNGTFVNGLRLEEGRTLREGDIIECGHTFFIFREGKISPRPAGCAPVALELPPLYYQMSRIYPYVATEMSIHLFGETGTGKEVVARAIHKLSGRLGAFVGVNCAAIPENLFESELFGHVKGAFSGASERKVGQILTADKGTLFLDEIGELPLSMQAKLLRFLELREVLPVGASKPIPVDFRLVSATLCNLKEMVEAGTFRRDLYARLGHVLPIPPLRQHMEEFGPLVQAFLTRRLDERRKNNATIPRVYFTLVAARALVRHSWPFNVRELKHCIEGAFIAAMAESKESDLCAIDLSHLPVSIATCSELTSNHSRSGDSLAELHPLGGAISVNQRLTAAGQRSRGALRPTEGEIRAALKNADGHRAKTAELLGVRERTLYRWLKDLRIEDI